MASSVKLLEIIMINIGILTYQLAEFHQVYQSDFLGEPFSSAELVNTILLVPFYCCCDRKKYHYQPKEACMWTTLLKVMLTVSVQI